MHQSSMGKELGRFTIALHESYIGQLVTNAWRSEQAAPRPKAFCNTCPYKVRGPKHTHEPGETRDKRAGASHAADEGVCALVGLQLRVVAMGRSHTRSVGNIPKQTN